MTDAVTGHRPAPRAPFTPATSRDGATDGDGAPGSAPGGGSSEVGGVIGALLGSRVAGLPPVVRLVHATATDMAGHGVFRLEQASTGLGRWVSGRLGMPGAQGEVAATLIVHRTDDPAGPPARGPTGGAAVEERWSRSFGGEALRSTLRAEGDRLVERIGRIELTFNPQVVDGRLELRHVRTCVRLSRVVGWCLPVPGWLAPRVTASAGATPDGDQLDVEVRIRAPVIGTLLAYTGRLTPCPREAR